MQPIIQEFRDGTCTVKIDLPDKVIEMVFDFKGNGTGTLTTKVPSPPTTMNYALIEQIGKQCDQCDEKYDCSFVKQCSGKRCRDISNNVARCPLNKWKL